MSVDKILDRLEGVRKTSAGKWLARCPAHDDRHASFSVKETEDGKILCHCFAGCSVEDVLAAIGLDMSDFYPERISQPGQAWAKIPKFNASEIVKGAIFEASVLTVAVGRMLDGVKLSQDDVERIYQAIRTLDNYRMEISRG